MAKTLYTFTADLKQLEALNKKLKEAELAMKKLQTSTTASKKVIDKQANSTKQLNTQLDATKNKARQVATATNRVAGAGRSMTNVFKSAAVAIAAAFAVRAISGGIRGMINVFREFEARMAAVKAMSRDVSDSAVVQEEKFQKLKNTALELGRTTVFTAAQVAKLQEEYARLGFTTDEILKAQEATLALAAATGEDLGNAAAGAGSVLRAFTYDASQTQRVVDVMAASFTGSALNLERFTQSMKFVAPIAKNVGFTIEETTAMMMKLADAGLHGSIAGNALKNIFLKLGDANSKLAKHLGGPINSLDDLVIKLNELEGAAFGATQASELINARATPAFLTLIDTADGLAELRDQLALADGAAREMAAIRLNTLEGDIVLMRSAMEGLGIALTDTFDVTFRKVIDSFTRFLQSFTESQTALSIFRKTINLLVISLGALLARIIILKTWTIIYTTATWLMLQAAVASRKGVSFLTVTFARLTKTMRVNIAAIRTAKGAMATMNAVMLATPWGLLLTAVAGAVMLFSSWGDTLDTTALQQGRLTRSWERSVEQLGELKEGTKEYGEAMQKIVKDYSAYFKHLDIEILKKERILELDAKLAGATDEKGELMTDELKGLQHLADNYDIYMASVKVHAEKTFQALRDLEANAPENPLVRFLQYAPDVNATTDEIIQSFENLQNALNRIETSKLEGDLNLGVDLSGSLTATGEEIYSDSEFMVKSKKFFEEGGALSEFFGMATERVDRSSDKFRQSVWSAFELDKGLGIMGTVDVTTLFPKIKLIGSDEYFNMIPKGLEDVKADITGLLGDINKEIGADVVDNLVTVRQKVRTDYLADLEDFRDMKDLEAQKDQIALIEQLTTTAALTQMYMQIVAEHEKEGGVESQAAKDFLERQRDKGVAITEFIDTYNLKWKDAAGKMVNIKQTIGIEATELERHLEDLENNMNKSNKSVDKSATKHEKLRLQKTKDYYKKLRKLQADSYTDEFRRMEENAVAKLDFTKKELDEQLRLMKANINQIEYVQGRIIGGFEAGRFIKDNQKAYQVLKEISADVFKELIKGGDEALAGITDTATGTVYTITGVMDDVLQEEREKIATLLNYLTAVQQEFEREMEITRQKARDNDVEAQLEYLDLLLQQERAGRRSIEDLQKGEFTIEGTNRFSRERSFLQTHLTATLKMINDNETLKLGLIEKTLESELVAAGDNSVAILTAYAKYEEAKTRITLSATNERLEAELDTAEKTKESIVDQIQHYADIYNQVFDMFSALQTNALDIQLQREQAYHEEKSAIMADNLAFELEQLEGNSEAQQNLRETYADRQETIDKQLAAKETEIAKKRFQTEKVNSVMQAIIQGALAVVKVTAQTGVVAPFVIPSIIAMTAAQVAVIMAQQFVGKKGGLIPEFAKGGMVYGPSHESGGVKFNAGGRVVELEGGEAVINKRSTAMFHSQLSAMNKVGGGKSFAEGGITPGTGNMLSSVGGGNNMEAFAQNIVDGINSKKVVVTEADISTSQQSVAVTEATSSLF